MNGGKNMHEINSRNHAAINTKKSVQTSKILFNLAIALSIFISILTIISSFAFAANNPGHDSLYILRTGDNVTGNFGITGTLNVSSTIYEGGSSLNSRYNQSAAVSSLNSTKALAGSSAACTYGIANITLNSNGVPTVTCAAQQGTGSMSSWLLAASGTASTQSITNGTIVNFTAGSGINVTRSAAAINIASTLGTSIDDTEISDGAVDGGTGGEIQDNTITAADLASGDFSSKITSGTYSISISGNANTLDSLDSTYFTRRSTSENSVYSSDTRDINYNASDRDRGLYVDFKSNSADGLSDGGSYHGVLTFRAYGAANDLSGGYPHQLGFTANNNLWIRVATSNVTWGSWYKFWHQNNDGSGSTLDADLLDGQNGSYYQAASSALTTSSSWSGGDLSGTGLAATVAANSVALGTDTTGNYVGDVAAGNGISVSGTPGEGYTETISLSAATCSGSEYSYWNGSSLLCRSDANSGGDITSVAVGSNVCSSGACDIATLDGSGSTLDADLLDGQNGSYYQAASSALTTSSSWSGGDLSGTGLAATVAANSVALGTDTTGNYVAGLTQGTGVIVSGSAGEGWSPSVALNTTYLSATYVTMAGGGVANRIAFISGTKEVDGVPVMYYTANKIGLNTASPSYLLDVNGTANVVAVMTSNITSAADTNIYITQGGGGGPTGTNVYISGGNVGGDTGGSVYINGGNGLTTNDGNIILGNTYGNVGIGTSSPSQKLHVNGTVNISDSLYVASKILSGAWEASAIEDTYISNAITVSGGTLGSNTISSGAVWNTAGTLIIGDNGDRIDVNSSGWDIVNSVISGATWQGSAVAYNYGGTGLNIAPDDHVLVGSGSSWVNRSLPNCVSGNKLLYTAATNTFSCEADANSGGDITAVGSMTTGAPFSDSTATGDWLGLGAAMGRIEFDDQTPDEVNIINASVGIGTSTPLAKLNVDSITDSDILRVDENYASGSLTANNSLLYLRASAMANTGYFIRSYDSNTGAYPFVVRGDGNVGIGTAAPSQKLVVTGAINVTNVIYMGDPGAVTCDSGARGAMRFDQQYSGSEDALFVCMSNTTGGYSWIMVARGG